MRYEKRIMARDRQIPEEWMWQKDECFTGLISPLDFLPGARGRCMRVELASYACRKKGRLDTEVDPFIFLLRTPFDSSPPSVSPQTACTTRVSSQWQIDFTLAWIHARMNSSAASHLESPEISPASPSPSPSPPPSLSPLRAPLQRPNNRGANSRISVDIGAQRSTLEIHLRLSTASTRGKRSGVFSQSRSFGGVARNSNSHRDVSWNIRIWI